MKKMVLEPSNKNLVDSFTSDSIGRSGDVCAFANLINSIEGPFAIALDGKWGSGKTFFVKQAKLLFDASNPLTNYYESNEADRIRDRITQCDKGLKEQIAPIVTAYYDAWQHDDEDEPLLSLIYEIMKDTYSTFQGEYQKSWSGIIGSIADAVSNRNISEVIRNCKGEDIFEKQKNNENVKRLIEEYLKSLLPEKGNKLVIFVDELDRCTPSFAVKLLERVKHFFSCENVIFVFSVNISELQHTVKCFYGNGFDACRYIDRFFDLLMEMPKNDMESYARNFGVSRNRSIRQSICMEVVSQMDMSMREAANYFQMSKACAYEITDGKNSVSAMIHMRDGGYESSIIYDAVIPIAMGLKISNTTEYEDFINGRNYTWLERVICSSDNSSYLLNCILDNDESYSAVTGMKEVKYTDKIKELYDAIFVKNYTNAEYETRLGNAIFTPRSKEKVLDALAFVSPYAKYISDDES